MYSWYLDLKLLWTYTRYVELVLPMHIHLDLVGGLSGNMFVGAMLNFLKIPVSEMMVQIEHAGFADMVELTATNKNDGILTGTYFNVEAETEAHQHRHYSDIRGKIEDSLLDEQTKKNALGIFKLLAEAEATVHGRDIESVAFHEVGAWDSIADVVTAAWLIVQAGVTSTSVSPLPLGGGRVQTAHGALPVPAPATELLLEGFDFIDDGISGERITPTGAAILKFLNPGDKPSRATLLGAGYGFGSKTFPGISNVTRVLFFDPSHEASIDLPWLQDRVVQLSFEVDDQTPEDLSVALEKLRQHPGVYDVNQSLVYGKKGRMMIAVQALTDPKAESGFIAACFEETTTLGIRRLNLDRAILERSEHSTSIGSEKFRTKRAVRPGTNTTAMDTTTKVEIDDIAHLPGIVRRRIKTEIESQPSED